MSKHLFLNISIFKHEATHDKRTQNLLMWIGQTEHVRSGEIQREEGEFTRYMGMEWDATNLAP